MYEIINEPGRSNGFTVTTFTSELLNAIPMALAAPILSYLRTKTQRDLLAIAIGAKKEECREILRTMQVLAKEGQLTPELSTQLMMVYMQQPY